jgi:hypothetical protein
MGSTADLTRGLDTTKQCDVRTRGTSTLTLGGPLGPVPTLIADAVRDTFVKSVASKLRDALNAGIPRAVAASFGLEELPPGSVASVRSFENAPGSISIGIAVGAFGDVLSTFAG